MFKRYVLHIKKLYAVGAQFEIYLTMTVGYNNMNLFNV